MRAVVVYESMFGNTHMVAHAIASGLNESVSVLVTPVRDATEDVLDDAELIVVGGPTHVHGLTRPSTRKAAADTAHKPDCGLNLEPDAEGPGLREWFESLGRFTARGAAFDTRIDAPAVLTGSASKGIARRLRQHGFALVAEPESFLVTKDNRLEDGESTRAREWGASLAAALSATAPA
jgi:hypothetical protein